MIDRLKNGNMNPRLVRRGAALIVLVITLALLGAIMAAIAFQMNAGHRILEQRGNELQADWLARSGIEIAISRIMAESSRYSGETIAIVPRSQVRIGVVPEPGSPNDFRVKCEARYPDDTPQTVVRALEYRLRRLPKGNDMTIEACIADAR
jgi:hypothetical protein